MKIVEYDLDEEDGEFIGALNDREPPPVDKKKKKKAVHYTFISEDDFEALFDFFEKEWFYRKFQKDSLFNFRRFTESESFPCCVCNDSETEEDNQIVFCSVCEIAVHQICYGIDKLPTGVFTCRRCTEKVPARCIFCTERSGAFKKTRDGRWAHVTCALWIPEVSFGSASKMEPIDRVNKIPKKKWDQLCSICGRHHGVCLKCSETNCEEIFHVTCARSKGYYVELQNGEGSNVLFLQYCRKHTMVMEMDREDKNFGFKPLPKEELLKLDLAMRQSGRSLPHPDLKTLELCYQYWRYKRKHHPTSLLRRYQKLERRSYGKLSEEEYYSRFLRLRQEFEKLRLLIDLVRKRELMKREQGKILDEIFEAENEYTKQQIEDELEAERRQRKAKAKSNKAKKQNGRTSRSPSPSLKGNKNKIKNGKVHGEIKKSSPPKATRRKRKRT